MRSIPPVRVSLVGIVSLILGISSTATASSASRSGIKGIAYLEGCGPPQPNGPPPCHRFAFRGVLVDVIRGQCHSHQRVARVRANAQGRFQVLVRPGRYILRARRGRRFFERRDFRVVVDRHRITHGVTLIYDNGQG